MRQFVTNLPRVRLLADRGIEALVAGVNHVRFQREIRHPDNANTRSNYCALRDRQISLRTNLAAKMAVQICPEDMAVQVIVQELDQVAHALGMLREEVLEERPARILRELVESTAAA